MRDKKYEITQARYKILAVVISAIVGPILVLLIKTNLDNQQIAESSKHSNSIEESHMESLQDDVINVSKKTKNNAQSKQLSVISGHILDDENNVVEGAVVFVDGIEKAKTDSLGVFNLNLSSERETRLKIVKNGYPIYDDYHILRSGMTIKVNLK